jgi:hypothetical protein
LAPKRKLASKAPEFEFAASMVARKKGTGGRESPDAFFLPSVRVEDRDDGYVGLILIREKDDSAPAEVARIIFWDACGQWLIEMLDGELPRSIVEELIAEAKLLVLGSPDPPRAR